MDLSVQKYQHHNPSFGLKFYRNANFEEVINTCNKLQELDQAFNKLLHLEGDGDIVIIHGINAEGKMFSSFALGRNSVRNSVEGCSSPIEATTKAIFELIDPRNSKLRTLLGGKRPKVNLTEDYIYDRYTNR